MNLNFNQKKLPFGSFETVASPIENTYDGEFSYTNNNLYVDELDGSGFPVTDFDSTLDSGGTSYTKATSRLGETQLIKLISNSPKNIASNTGVYLRDLDYLVFKLGDVGYSQYESSVKIDDINKPIHVVCIYTKNSIKIIVNGKVGNESFIIDSPFNDLLIQDRFLYFCMPNKISPDSIYFDSINYDTVAFYNTVISNEVALRHYIYGLGYSIDRSFIKNFGGVMYDTYLQKTQTIKKIDYLNQGTWSRNTIIDNLEFRDYLLSTKTYKDPFVYISDSNYNLKNMISSDNTMIFPENFNSYVEIENYESIIGGATKLVSAKFSIDSTHITNISQQLIYVSSIQSTSTLSFEILNRTVSAKLNINGVETTKTFNLTAGTGKLTFIISFASSINKLEISVFDQNNSGRVDNFGTVNIFPMQKASMRLGSKPSFLSSAIPTNLTGSDIGRFDGKFIQLDILDSDEAIDNYQSYPSKFNGNIYQLFVDSNKGKFCVSTKGTFSFLVSLAEFVGVEYLETNISDILVPLKIEIGSKSADIQFSCMQVGNNTPLSTGNVLDMHLPKISGTQPKVKDIYFNITGTMFTTDTNYNPGVLDYIRIYSYGTDSTNSYFELNSDNIGDNLRYYPGNNFAFKKMPDLKKTTDLYRSFNTGIAVGHFLNNSYAASPNTIDECKPYIKIPFNGITISNNLLNKKITGVSFSAIINESNYVSENPSILLKIDNTVITDSSILISNNDFTVFLNGQNLHNESGVQQIEYKKFIWNHYSIKFNTPIIFTSDTKDVIFGNNEEVTGSGWNIDNICIFGNNVSDENIKTIYNRYFSEKIYKVGEVLSIKDIKLNDSEVSGPGPSGKTYKYQLLNGQSSFYKNPIDYCSISNHALVRSGLTNDYVINTGTDKDLLKIDPNITINLGYSTIGSLVLLKNQITTLENGIYIIKSINNTTAPYQLTLTKIYTPSQTGEIFYINLGRNNKNKFFIYKTSGYEQAIVQQKAIGYVESSQGYIESLADSKLVW